MKKLVKILLIILMIVVSVICPNGVVAKDNSDLLPQLYFYGDLDKLTSKEDKTKIKIEYKDGDNSFDGYAEIKWQGSSSINYEKKNYTIKLYKDSNLEEKLKVDFGWGKQNKYCLKANWIDKTHSRNIVTAKLASKIQKKYNLFNDTPNNGVIDGFPIEVYLNGDFLGLYTMNIPKDAWMFNMDEDNSKHTAIVGDMNNSVVFFNSNIDEFSDWELEVGEDNEETLKAFNRLITFVKDSTDEEFKENINEYFNLDSLLNYYSVFQLAELHDNQAKNMMLVTYDQKVWYTSLYDLDTSWGTHWYGNSLFEYSVPIQCSSLLWGKLERTFPNEIANRYFELRKDILSKENILKEFYSFYNSIPENTFKKENERWKNIPGYDLKQIEEFLSVRIPVIDKYIGDMFTVNAGVYGYCIKEDDNIIMKVEPLRNDIKIETNSSYTFDKSGTAIFIYSDYAGNMGYVEADALIYKNLFE